MKLAFIGAGKMATAMARGLVETNTWARADLLAADVAPAAREAFTLATGVACAESAERIVGAADVLVLAVKPQGAQAAVAPLAAGSRGKLVISICAGLKLATLARWFGSERIVRVMPNTPLMVGQGAAVFACAAGVTAADKAVAQRIFGALGIVHELPEDLLDAVTALSGSGPAYVFEFIQALADAGAALGLPADVALALAAQTVAGAAEMVRRGLGTPDALRDAVTSKGGTTAAALAVLAKRDFRGLLREALTAARDRSVELGRGEAGGRGA
jgi:pyrroline-5-carboxylate reductase